MIKDILKLMSLGGITLPEMARRLGAGLDDLKNRLEMMERMGYVEALHEVGRSECPSCHTSKCLAGDCHSESAIYHLTKKGLRCLGFDA